MEVFFGIAADRILIDTRTNQVSIIDVYEKLEATSFPVLINKITFLFYLSRLNSEKAYSKLQLVCSLDNVEIFQTNVEVDFKNTLTNRIVAEIVAVTIPKKGTLRSSLFDSSKKIGELELPVDQFGSTSIS